MSNILPNYEQGNDDRLTRDKRSVMSQLARDIRASELTAIELPVPQVVIAHLVDARDLLERYLAEGDHGHSRVY